MNETKTLVVEDGGQPLIGFLKQTDPFRESMCRFGDQKCMVETSKDCSKMSVVYEITCNQCTKPVRDNMEIDERSRDPGNQGRPQYIGMTRSSVHSRMLDHLRGQKSKSGSNPLFRHDRDMHNGDPQTYTARIMNCQRNILPLTVMEALYIEKQQEGSSMNEKNEFGRGALIRLTAERSVG